MMHMTSRLVIPVDRSSFRTRNTQRMHLERADRRTSLYHRRSRSLKYWRRLDSSHGLYDGPTYRVTLDPPVSPGTPLRFTSGTTHCQTLHPPYRYPLTSYKVTRRPRKHFTYTYSRGPNSGDKGEGKGMDREQQSKNRGCHLRAGGHRGSSRWTGGSWLPVRFTASKSQSPAGVSQSNR